MRLLKIFSALIVLCGAGLVGFAYLGDLTPQQSEVRVPVQMNAE